MAKKCRICKQPFQPSNSLQITCRAHCAILYARKIEAKKRMKAEWEWNAETRRRRMQMNASDRRYQIKSLQREFNTYIRERDKDEPCICCGEYGPDESWKPGGQYDCGHFLAVGSHPELRFEELNAHKQLKSCNAGAGKYTRKNWTVSQEYEVRLRKKIGDAAADWLKGPHEPKKYTLEEIRELRRHYKAKLKALKARSAA